MKRIFYDPDRLDLVFSTASALLYLSQKFPDEQRYLVPIKTAMLNVNLSPIMEAISEELKEISEDTYFDPNGLTNQNVKYVVLGFYPTNQSEEKEIVKFFDKNVDKICLWVDGGHHWPDNLRSFFKSTSDNIIIDQNKTNLELLSEFGYPVFDEWLAAEKAIIASDMTNHLAARYYQALRVSKSGKVYDLESSYDVLTIASIIEEIIANTENSSLTEMVNIFPAMVEESDRLKELFKDDNPIFTEAKKIGRPVGVLSLDQQSDFIDFKAILDYGKEKFPWLCILEVSFEGESKMYFASKKIPIVEILDSFAKYLKTGEELLRIINSELLNFKE
jgi:hypothetical protein